MQETKFYADINTLDETLKRHFLPGRATTTYHLIVRNARIYVRHPHLS